MSPRHSTELVGPISPPLPTNVFVVLGAEGSDSRLPGVSEMTLPQLFGLTAEEEASLWSLPAGYSLADAGLSEDVLGSIVGVSPLDEVEILLSCAVGHLAALCVDEADFQKLLESVAAMFGSRLGRPVAIGVPSNPMLKAPLLLLCSTQVGRIPGAERHNAVLDALGLTGLGDLLVLSEQVAVERAGLTIASLQAVNWLKGVGARALELENVALSAYGLAPGKTPNVAEFCSKALSSLLDGAKGHHNKDGRLVRVFAARNGLDSGRPLTLQECGTELSVTRERVRQLEKSVFKVVDKTALAAALWPLHVAVWSAIVELGGAAEADSINDCLSSSWEVPAASAYLARLTDLFSDIRVSKSSVAVLVLDRLHCGECEAVLHALDLITEATEPVSLAQLSEMVWVEDGGCQKCGLDHAPSPALIEDSLREESLASRGLKLSKAGLYGRGVGARDPGTRGGQLLGALRRAGGPMHFTEILAAVNEANPARPFTKGNVYSRLDALDEAVSWDSGTFIHIANMPCPYGLIRKAEDWIRQRFKHSDYLPFVSSHGPFHEYEEELVAAGVPSALALYSLLRISSERDLAFPRYPYVYQAEGFEGRSPLAAVMAEYVRRAGAVVSLGEIRDFVVGEMGFKLFQFDQRVYDLPDILATDDGFIHRDYVHIDNTTRHSLLEYAEHLVGWEGHVSIDRVFSDKRVDCALVGITGPRYLYSIIEAEESEFLRADRYPVLTRGGGETESATGIQLLVSQYLKDAGHPVSLEQLEEEFVSRRHYRRGSVFAVAYRSDVLRYASASLVHADALGWNQDKELEFEEAALTLWESALARGELVARAEDLVEWALLPELQGSALWTHQLAADLIAKSDRLVLIGNARNAYSAANHPAGIASLGNLVGVLVRDRFGGGVAVAELEKTLRSCGALAHDLTPALLTDEPSVEFVGFEVRVARGGAAPSASLGQSGREC